MKNSVKKCLLIEILLGISALLNFIFPSLFDHDKHIILYEEPKKKEIFHITEDSYLISIYLGEDVKNIDQEAITSKLNELYPNCDVDIVVGNQPVYSFLLGVE